MTAVSPETFIFDKQLTRERDYWAAKLKGRPGFLSLRSGCRASGVEAGGEGVVEIEVAGDSYRRLSRVAGGSSFLMYTFLMAALKVCYRSYAGHDTIIVGSPALKEAGRPNALAVVSEVEGRQTFRRFLMEERQTLLDAYAHQRYPFARVLKDVGAENGWADSPPFDTMLALNGLHDEMPQTGQRISITFDKDEARLAGRVEFDSGLYERESVERFGEHYANVLLKALQDPDTLIRDLDVLSDDERRLILRDWNRTEASYPAAAGKCLHELIAEQAARTPDNVAVVFEDRRLTYADLEARSNQLAHYLRGCGVGAEVRVGVLMERSIEMVVALCGVLKAGGAYVPLDPEYPSERLSFMLADTRSPVVLAQRHLLERLPETEAKVVCLDAEWAELAGQSGASPAGKVSADAAAYVIYTSGSTGRPKGVLIPHSGICNRLLWMQDEYRLTGQDRVLQKTPYSFDVSVWEFFWPLMTGATLVVARPAGHQDSAYLVELIRREQITTAHFVPSMLRVFLEEQALESCDSLKRVVCSGEALPYASQERFQTRLRAGLHNLYGPTEASVDATFWACEPTAEQVVPIGRPIANMECFVLGADLQPLPVGVAGELFIGGVGLARGYVGRPDLTAEKFIPHPHSSRAGARLYRTGDLACYRGDGAIEFLGRLDHQVKIRGFRIELGEIEETLLRHAAVREAVVTARDEEGGEKRLVAYVVAVGGGHVKAGDLRGYLNAKLPEYMVPSAFVFLNELPLTASGKVDRKRLPAPLTAASAHEGEFQAPLTETEKVLAEIWAQVLRVERVSADKSFFEMGGHSLLATQVISRVREALQVEMPLRSLFNAPTVAGFAEAVDATRRAEKGLVAPPVVPVARGGELPLSFAQQRLWFLDQWMPQSAAFNICDARRLTGALNEVALRRALNEVARRHESLRTTFPAVAGQAVQVINEDATIPLPLIDLSEMPEAEREAEAQRIVKQDMSRPFDLARGPLFRAGLLRLGAEEHVLTVGMHHVISDAWSLGVLADEVSTLYRAFCEGEPSPLPELPVQYADFAAWQRGWMQGDVLDEHLDYWKSQLAGAPPVLDLAIARPRPEAQTFNGAKHPVVLSKALTDDLRALSRRENVTLFMTLLAAFNVLLHHHSGREEIVVGTDVANRNRFDTERLIGFFINQLVLRTSLSGNPSFRGLLGRVREVTLGAYTHQDLPFDRLVEALKVQRSPEYPPLIQVKLVLQNTPPPSMQLSNLSTSRMANEGVSADFDLTLTLWDEAEGLRGRFKYNTDLFDAAAVARLSEDFKSLLEVAVANPSTALDAHKAVLEEADERRRQARQLQSKEELARKFQTLKRKAVSAHGAHG